MVKTINEKFNAFYSLRFKPWAIVMKCKTKPALPDLQSGIPIKGFAIRIKRILVQSSERIANP